MKTLLILFVLTFPITAFSQSPDWIWALQTGQTEHDEASDIATDPAGYIYTIGNYESDSISFSGVSLLRNSSLSGILGKFICKHDPNGNLIWVKNIYGSGYVTGLDVDDSGNCYVTGYFSLYNLPFAADTLISNGGYDIFLLKYDSSGTEVWARGAGGYGYEEAYDIDVDIHQNIYITGRQTNHDFYFGTDTLLGTVNAEQSIVLKYDHDGNELWGRNIVCGFNVGETLAADGNGNIYLLGSFNNPQLIVYYSLFNRWRCDMGKKGGGYFGRIGSRHMHRPFRRHCFHRHDS